MKIIAHRGDTSTFPENTIEAFAAAKQHGADGIEFDVHETKDGELIIHHDYYLGNPDNGHGIIPDITSDYITHLTIDTKYHIPTLEELFAEFSESLHYELELKSYTIEAMERIVALVQKYELEHTIEFTSPHPYILQVLKQSHPKLVTGCFAMPRPDWMDARLYGKITIANATIGNIDVVHYPHQFIDQTLVTAVHETGKKIQAANCDTNEDLKRIISLGVDQISTNQLGQALNTRRSLLG